MDKTYYFVVFEEKEEENKNIYNMIIENIYPVVWLVNRQAECPEIRVRLLFWSKISQKIAKVTKEKILF